VTLIVEVVVCTGLGDGRDSGCTGDDPKLGGATPRISDIATADLDASALEAIARAR
jgi:hypothetical protein